MKDGDETRIVIRSEPAEIRKVQAELLPRLEVAGYPQACIFAIRLSLDEAIANAIHHGHRDDPDKLITITFQIQPDETRITVCDQGTGFCPEDVPDCTEAQNLDFPHGRGVMLIRAYMTQVQYNQRGNCVTMIKRRDCQKPHAEN